MGLAFFFFLAFLEVLAFLAILVFLKVLVFLEILIFLAILEGSKLRFLAYAAKDLCKKIPRPRVRVRETREISVECTEVLLIISPPSCHLR